MTHTIPTELLHVATTLAWPAEATDDLDLLPDLHLEHETNSETASTHTEMKEEVELKELMEENGQCHLHVAADTVHQPIETNDRRLVIEVQMETPK